MLCMVLAWIGCASEEDAALADYREKVERYESMRALDGVGDAYLALEGQWDVVRPDSFFKPSEEAAWERQQAALQTLRTETAAHLAAHWDAYLAEIEERLGKERWLESNDAKVLGMLRDLDGTVPSMGGKADAYAAAVKAIRDGLAAEAQAAAEAHDKVLLERLRGRDVVVFRVGSTVQECAKAAFAEHLGMDLGEEGGWEILTEELTDALRPEVGTVIEVTSKTLNQSYRDSQYGSRELPDLTILRVNRTDPEGAKAAWSAYASWNFPTEIESHGGYRGELYQQLEDLRHSRSKAVYSTLCAGITQAMTGHPDGNSEPGGDSQALERKTRALGIR